MPSPIEEQPGLLIRDAFRYSDTVLVIPPSLVGCLAYFDGKQTDTGLMEELERIFQTAQAEEVGRQLREALSGAGFLIDETFAKLKELRHTEFSQAPVRQAAYAGTAYPAELDALRATMAGYLDGAGTEPGERAGFGKLVGIAAPHVSPSGGWQSYRAAYSELVPELADRTFVILGTSHYGELNRFGLTRKPYETPYGSTEIDHALLEELEGLPAVLKEDYCHAIEHSIEFQVLFLQAIYGPKIRIVPILCGPLGSVADFTGTKSGGAGKLDEDVSGFLDALEKIAAREKDRLFWVLGVDMAHIGRRYGDSSPAIAEEGQMATVRAEDAGRIARIKEGNAKGFWDLVRGFEDELRWCGASAFYSFLRAVPEVRGRLRRYEQWNIDQESVVSFAGISFTSGAGSAREQ